MPERRLIAAFSKQKIIRLIGEPCDAGSVWIGSRVDRLRVAPLRRRLWHGDARQCRSERMEIPAEYLNVRAALAPLQVLLDERVLDVPDHLLDLLPVGVYVCDRAGLIVRYNRAAAKLWGCSPKIGDPTVRFCGSYRLYGMKGALIPHAKCPMADVLATGQGLRDEEIIIERPDGAHIVALVNIAAIEDNSGRVVGAVNVFRERPEQASSRRGLNGHSRNADTILQSLPAAVYTTDAVGHIT